jgi:hypothetical protein
LGVRLLSAWQDAGHHQQDDNQSDGHEKQRWRFVERCMPVPRATERRSTSESRAPFTRSGGYRRRRCTEGRRRR